MNIVVKNREGAEQFVAENLHRINISVISITDPKSEQANFDLFPEKFVLRLSFHDVDEKIGNHILFNEEMAEQIWDFVKKVGDSSDTILIHCEAGISRSAGVAGALAKILRGNDKKFMLPPYIPNKKVYGQLMKTYYDRKAKGVNENR